MSIWMPSTLAIRPVGPPPLNYTEMSIWMFSTLAIRVAGPPPLNYTKNVNMNAQYFSH